MVGRYRPRVRPGPAVVGSLGLGTLLVHVYHMGAHDFSLVVLIFGVMIPMGLSSALLGFALWLRTAGFGERADRVGGWTVVGAVAVLAVGSVVLVFQMARGIPLDDAVFVLATLATGGSLLGFLLGVYDVQRVTTRRELETERETAGQMGRRLTVLNRVLRHDVRNRVNVIRGNAELIERGTGDVETVARTIKAQADDLVDLSERARELEAALSQREVETEPVDLGALLAAKAHAVRDEHGYATVHVDVPDEVYATVSPRIDSVVDELVDNAIRHNEVAEPTVWIEAEEVDDGDAVAVTVADDGAGIPPDEVAVLERGHETALEHASGLGLWLVNWIVTESGGSVAFEEREVAGSAVILTLPRASSEDGGEDDETNESPGADESVGSAEVGAPE